MPWRGPSYDGEFPSLGWDVLDWAEQHFRVPDGPLAGEPLRLTDEQAAIVVRFYGLDDRGRWLFRRAAVRRAQGWGKSPILAVISLGELAGPTHFGGWSKAGEPIGVRPSAPWVQIAACSEDQTDNTYAAAYTMAKESDLNGPLIDVGQTRMFLQGEPGKLEPVTSSAGSRLGQRITFAVLDETHLWTARNGGRKLAATIRRNAGKMGGRTFESTNAHHPGEESVAESTYQASLKAAGGLLYDSVEAPEVADLTDRPAVIAALEQAYGDSAKSKGGWVDLERIAEECADPGNDPMDLRRFYFNHLVSNANAFVDISRWEDLEADIEVPDGTRVGLGFDGSISDDHTVLWGCTENRHLFKIATWGRPANATDWRVPRSEVTDTLRETFERYDVGYLYCDPPKWWSEIEAWEALWPDRVVSHDTNVTRRFAPSCDRFATAVREGSVTHDGSPELTASLAACARRKVSPSADDEDGRTKFVIVKADTRKIDEAVAAVLALEAAEVMPAAVAAPEPWFAVGS